MHIMMAYNIVHNRSTLVTHDRSLAEFPEFVLLGSMYKILYARFNWADPQSFRLLRPVPVMKSEEYLIMCSSQPMGA